MILKKLKRARPNHYITHAFNLAMNFLLDIVYLVSVISEPFNSVGPSSKLYRSKLHYYFTLI